MSLTDFNKYKSLKVTDVSGQPTISRTACLKITSGDDTTTGTGEIVLDWSNISDKSDIGVYDENNNLLDYHFESFDSTNETAVIWVYRSWVRDGTVQAKIAYGNGPSDQSVATSTVFSKETDLEAGYLFNEISGDLLDVSGNNIDGTVTGATQGATGIVDGAYSFDGNDDVVGLTGILGSAPNAFAISFWFYPRDDALGFIVTLYDDINYLISMDDSQYVSNPRMLIVRAEQPAGNWSSLVTYQLPALNQWYHVTVIYDDSVGHELYVDASSKDTSTNTDSFDTDESGSYLASKGNEYYYDGLLDDVRFYSTNPSSDEITALYDATKSSPSLFDQEAGGGFATISGQVTLSGSGVEGVKVFLVNDTTGELKATITTDTDGNYSFDAFSGDTYHVAVQYDDGTDKYNAKSKPYLVP